MDIDAAREKLKQYRVLIAKIARLKLMPGISPENRKLYSAETKECILERDRIEKSINAVDGGILSEILALKYMCGKTIEEIALEICYSRRQTERLHLKALGIIKI